jgi:hypothetical protein
MHRSSRNLLFVTLAAAAAALVTFLFTRKTPFE